MRKRIRVLFCCIFCVLLLFVFPVARTIHESHFLLSTTIRKSGSLNEVVGKALRAALVTVDGIGTSPVFTQLNVTLFRELNSRQSYFRLAQESLKGLHRLHPIRDHSAWYHGVADAWAFWVMMIMQCSVRVCSDLPYDLESNNFRANLAWRALSGSDDVLWASLALLRYPHFLDLEYTMNGGRGALQLYNEAERHYIFRSGNRTSFYWDSNREYRSTISATLWIAASAQLFEQTGNKKYFENAQSGLAGLLESEAGFSPILENGHVYDGRFKDGSTQYLEFSYNSGVALAALSAMYRITQKEQYLRIGQEIVETSLKVFWGNGELGEVRPLRTLDQFNFKGLYLHYVTEFLTAFRNSTLGIPTPQWIHYLNETLQKTSTFVVHERLHPKGFCAHWGESDAATRCLEEDAYRPQCMVVASQLFTLLHLLQNF